MNTLLLPTIYFLISLLLGLSLVVLSHKFLAKTLKKRCGLGADSLPFNILASGLLLSLAMLMSESARPMISLINLLSRAESSNWLLTAGGYIFGFYVMVIVLALGIISGSITFFHRMTGELDEMGELRKGNVGVALLLAVVIVAMTIFLKAPLVSVFEAMIPYPDFSY
jgi:heme/copper-type cytochrome/quinol oxidase subunit 2